MKDKWIAIFKGGKQVDSNGRQHDGDALIDKAIKTFDPSFHEPPAVIGHPEDNAPAYGWVESLKKTGNIMYAKFKDMAPEFVEMVKKGLFKKRSASFYPDGRLRHVGFLGAAAPAVKGLPDIGFKADEESVSFEFAEINTGNIIELIKKFLLWLKERNTEIDDILISDVDDGNGGNGINPKYPYAVADILNQLTNPTNNINQGGSDMTKTTFTEADIEAAKKKAAEEAGKKVKAEFAEKEKERVKEERKKEISNWIDAKIKEGIIPPAWKDAGITAFAQSLDGDIEIDFSQDKKQSSLVWFKDFIETFGKSPIFKEMVKKENSGENFTEAETEWKLGEEIAGKL